MDGKLQILQTQADIGDEFAAERLAKVLAERGDLEELRTRTDAGEGRAAKHLDELLTGVLLPGRVTAYVHARGHG